MSTKIHLKTAAKVVGSSAAAVPSAQSADVGSMLESLRKSKKFKQLATYSIQVLQKAIAPPRVGWEIYAKQAMELNAADDITEVAQRFAVDAEIFTLATTSLSAIAAVPKGLTRLASGAAVAAVIGAVREHFNSIEFTAGSSEDVARLLSALRLVQVLARADTVAFVAAGGITLLLDIACITHAGREANGGHAVPASAFAIVCPLIASASSVLDRVSRTKAGLDYLVADKAVMARVVRLAATNLNVAEIRNPDLRKSFRRAASMARLAGRMGSTPSKGSGSSETPSTPRAAIMSGGFAALTSPAGTAASGRDNNGHLESIFRVLDRAVRSDVGRDAVLAVHATSVLPTILEQIQAGRAGSNAKGLETLLMRILARLLGSDLRRLVARLAGEESDVSMGERILCARLLSGLMVDSDHRDALLSNDGELAAKLVGLLTTAPLCDGEAVAPILQALCTVARAGPDSIIALFDVGCLVATGQVLVSRLDEGSVVAEAASFLTSMIDCSEMVTVQVNSETDSGRSRLLSPGAHSLPSLVARAMELNMTSDTAVLACLQYVEVCLILDDEEGSAALALSPAAAAKTMRLSNRVVRAMAHQPDAAPVQAVATDVLNYLASNREALSDIADAGIIPRIIANLSESDRSGIAGLMGGMDSPVKGMNKGMMSPGADDDDDMVTAAAAMGGDTRAAESLSASLVGSSMHLVTALCFLPSALAAAKDAGIIHAVLSGFSRHSADTHVYRLFREVISALDIDEAEVRAALDKVDEAAAGLQYLAGKADAEVFRPITEFCASSGLLIHPPAPGAAQSSLADILLENMALLEAVTVSPVFVAVIAACGGLPVLTRVMAVTAALRTVDKKSLSGKGNPRDADLVLTSIADQVMCRTCNTLAHVSRVAYEIAGSAMEHDAAYEPVDYLSLGIEEALYDKDALALLCRAMLAGAKPSYKAFAKDAITLLSWLASGQNHAAVRTHVDALVAAQGIEASVAFLRTHQSALDIGTAVAGALARISVSPKGSAAVAQRGASRQIIRMLRSTAALRTVQGDVLLLSFLRLLDTCARGGVEAAEVLRKQGTVDALVECIDAGTAADFFGMDEASAAAGQANIGTLGGHSGPHTTLEADPVIRRDITSAVTSLLSKLIGPELVRETAATVSAFGTTVQDQATASYSCRRGVKLSNYERGVVMRPLVLLGMLAETADAGVVGVDVMEAGALGAVRLAAGGLTVAKSFAAEGINAPSKGTDEELIAGIPAALRTIRQVLGPLIAKTSAGSATGQINRAAIAGAKAIAAAVPVAIRALEERPDCVSQALASLAALCSTELGAASLPSAADGRGVSVTLDALRSAGDAWEDERIRDAMWALAGVAALPDCRPLVIVAGAAGLAASLFTDMATESGADSVAAGLTLLGHCANEAKVASEILSSGILDSVRSALQRHCVDTVPAQARVLQAVAALVSRISITKDIARNFGGRGDEMRTLLKRIIKALAGSPTTINNPRCSEAVLDAIATSCTASGSLTEEAATAAQAAVIEADGERCIVMAMSSSAADNAVLAAGARALASIGASSTAAKTLAEIDEYASRIPEWLEAGWEVTAPEVIDLVAGMGAEMRALGSNIVGGSAGTDLSTLPDLGDTYKEVLMTIWRAMHAVCRDDVTSARAEVGLAETVGLTSGQGLYSARADVLGLGAQITGRLIQVGAAAVTVEGLEGPHAVSGEDAINVLATVFFAARDVAELGLVEASCRALDTALSQYGGEAVVQCSVTGIIASLTMLAERLEDLVNAGKAAEAAGGLGGSKMLKGAPLAELTKMLTLVENSMHALTSTARTSLAAKDTSSASLLDASVQVDLLDAAAHSSTEDAEAEDSTVEDACSDLQLTASTFVSAAAASKATADLPYIVLASLSTLLEDECAGPGKLAAHGMAPVHVTRGMHAHCRMISALAPRIRERITAGSSLRLGAVLKGVGALCDVAFPGGRKWRKAAGSILQGNRPEKGDVDLDAVPSATDGRAGNDVVSAKTAWAHTRSYAATAILPLFEALAASAPGSDAANATQEVSKTISVAALGFSLQASHPSSAIVSLSVLRALARLSDLSAPDMKAGALKASQAVMVTRIDRLTKMGVAGAYRALFAGLTAPGNEDSEEYAQEAISLVASLLRLPGVDLAVLGLNKASLLSLQAVVRRYPSNAVLSAAGGALLSALQAVYTEQSGIAFEGISNRAVAAMSSLVKSAIHRHMTDDGQMYYAKADGDDSSWEPPEEVNAAMKELVAVDRMTRQLEDEAVTAVSPQVVDGMVASLVAHSHDPGIVGILASALAKLASNPDNHAALLSRGVVPSLVKIMVDEGHENDPRCAEAFVNLVLPLSFDQDAVRSALGPSVAATVVLRIAERFNVHLTSHIGSPMSWVPENAPDYADKLTAMEAAISTDKEERMKRAPRLAQCAAQAIANLACDNTASAGGLSTVDVLMQNGAVDKLSKLMRAHPDNLRLLEDAICGLSNLAFVSDAIQMEIGRTCMDVVCAVASRFNGDTYVFEMTLRAIGNLTRVDENILRAVGFGVIRGMVDGMIKHADSPSTLKLCADVMGNMVSIDAKKQIASEAVRVLRETLGVATANRSGNKGGVSEASILAGLERGEIDVKEAICSLLYRDGGARALVDTMCNHPTSADLAASCLRALNYCVACPSLATTIVSSLDLPSKVVMVCNANDTSPDVIKRACKILGGMAGNEKLAAAVGAARAAPALLSVLHTHRTSRDLCYLAASVLTLLKGQVLNSAVSELHSVDQIAALFESGVNESDIEVYSVQLELLAALSSSVDLAGPIAAKAGPSVLHLLHMLTEGQAAFSEDEDFATLLSFTLSTLSSLVRHGSIASRPLLEGGLAETLCSLVDSVLTASLADQSLLLGKVVRRAVLHSVHIFADAVRPPAVASEDFPEALSELDLNAAQGAIVGGAGLLIERVLAAYKSIPDANNPGTLLYDAATTKTCVSLLSDLVLSGYTLSQGVTLDLGFMALGTGVGPENASGKPALAGVGAPVPATPNVKHAVKHAPGAAEPDVLALVETGLESVEVWTDGKSKRARLSVPVDRTKLVATFKDSSILEVLITRVKKVILGNPAGAKKKFFGKSARNEHSLVLETADDTVLLHVEFEDKADKARASTAVALAALAGVSLEGLDVDKALKLLHRQ